MKRFWEVNIGMDTNMCNMSINAKMTPWFFSFDYDQQVMIIFNIYTYAECKEPWT